ncbi:MAG: hypothetical protein AB1467_00800 [Candidatus Diapherotrites archaeon]
MKEFVMDSAVILNNFNFRFSGEEKYYTTNEVLDELIDFRSKRLVEAGLKQGHIEIREPSRDSIKKVERAAYALDARHRLSKADISIIALAFELKLPLLSDDIQVQKVCIQLDLQFDSVFRERIEEK